MGGALQRRAEFDRGFRVRLPVAACVFTLTFLSGNSYPIHPLDLTVLTTHVGPDGVNRTICVNTITNGGETNEKSKDILFGDPFLRNLYTVYARLFLLRFPSFPYLAPAATRSGTTRPRHLSSSFRRLMRWRRLKTLRMSARRS